jgi:hypothetical protein
MSQIRLTRTPEIKNVLSFLQRKYPTMSEAEIIKMALSEKYQEEIENAYNHLMTEGKKIGDKLLAKEGLKREDVTEQQFYDLFLNDHK